MPADSGALAAQLIARLGAGHSRRLGRGEVLFQQGHPARAIFAVTSGRLRLERTLESGAAVTLHVARAGETFAEAALFSDHYHCRAVAEVASEVTVIESERTRSALASEPDLALLFLRHLASQVSTLRAALEIRSLRTAADRLEAHLVLHQGSLEGDRPLSGLAPELGLTAEALYRAAARLEREGRLRRDGRNLQLITDRES